MFCPECGTENARQQKFCTRCGTSLLALEYARSIVSEMATGKTSQGLRASTVLQIVAWISSIGFIFTTLGAIVLSNIYDDPRHPPIGLFFGIAGLVTLILIVKQLLKLIHQQAAQSQPQPNVIPLSPATRTTNRNLGEGAYPYYSVTEEQTRNLETQR